MSKYRSQSVSLQTALVIVFMSFGAFFGTVKLVVPDKHFGLTPFSFADEGGDDGGDADDSGDKDDKDDDQDKTEEKTKKDVEKQKKETERQREDLKKSIRNTSASAKIDDDEDENKDESGDFGDNAINGEDKEDGPDSSEGMYKEKGKTLEKLDHDLAKAEEDILKQAEKGINVSVQLAALAQYREQLSEVGGAFDGNNLEAAKILAKQIRKEAYFLKKDAQDVEKVSKEMADVTKRFAKADAKLAELESLGGDASALRAQLAILRADYATLQATIESAPGTISRETVKVFAKKVQRVKSLVESAIFALGGEDDGELAQDHEDESDDIAEHLMDVAEIEADDNDSVATKARSVATGQKIAAKTVKLALDNLESRGKVAEFFFGTDQTSATQLSTEISAMQSRAVVLETAATQLTDADMKQILLDQAIALRNEATKLSAYLDAQNAGFSLFGWLFR